MKPRNNKEKRLVELQSKFHAVYKRDREWATNHFKDLKKKGMKYLGPITMYSYLQTVGVINSHEENCFLY